jgi:Flp pilus assembly protein TadG
MSSPRSFREALRAHLRREDGVAALEFAIVSMVFLVMLYGIITYGYIYGMDQSLNHAAEEGARAAISTTTDAAALSTAKQTAFDRLSNYQPSLQLSDITTEIVSNCDGTFKCIKVTIVYPWTSRPIIPAFPGLPTPGQLSAVALVQLT